MITDAIFTALCTSVAFVIDLFPTLTLPTWVTSLTTFIGDAIGGLNTFAWWIPLGAIGNAAALLLAATAIAWTIRGVRLAVSHLTGGGGAT